MFEIIGKDRDAVILFNVVDELTYRARSNLGPRAFRQLKRRMIVVGRLVPVGESWMVSGNLAVFSASTRDVMLASAAQQALSNPELAFRNPAKLAEARSMVARQHEAFVDLFGADLIVVPGIEVPDKVQEFERALVVLGEALRRIADLGLLHDLSDPTLAAYQFVGLVMYRPMNQVRFSGTDASPACR
jgi:hypothetical protein